MAYQESSITYDSTCFIIHSSIHIVVDLIGWMMFVGETPTGLPIGIIVGVVVAVVVVAVIVIVIVVVVIVRRRRRLVNTMHILQGLY